MIHNDLQFYLKCLMGVTLDKGSAGKWASHFSSLREGRIKAQIMLRSWAGREGLLMQLCSVQLACACDNR